MPLSTVLVAAQSFGERLDAIRAARAIGRGLSAGNPELNADLCPVDDLPGDLDARMREARAVVLVTECLNHETLLQRDAVCEVATRARQTGVPCYAVAGHDGLDRFEARILDLQVVLEAASERGLAAAGKKLAGIL